VKQPQVPASGREAVTFSHQREHGRGVEAIRPGGHRFLAQLAVAGVECLPLGGEAHAVKRPLVMTHR
jgi:hypothetical protein